jgi:hypothetical protein
MPIKSGREPTHPFVPYQPPPLPPVLSRLSLSLSLSHTHTHTRAHTQTHTHTHTTSYAAASRARTIAAAYVLAQRTTTDAMAAFFARGGAAAAAALVMVAAVLAASWAGVARADFAQDRAMCADRLMGLATCLTFVQDKATARAPTPDCCAGLKQVVAASKLCMCVLVKDRDEPALGFKINVTRAMDLPSLCSNPATFSDCPSTSRVAVVPPSSLASGCCLLNPEFLMRCAGTYTTAVHTPRLAVCAPIVALVVTAFLKLQHPMAHARATVAVPPTNRCLPLSLFFFDLAFGWQPAEILGMSPDAPEAEIFKEYAKKHESNNGTTIPAAATGILPSATHLLLS